MFRYGLMRLFSKGKVLNPHTFILTEIKNNNGTIPIASVSKITEILHNYEDIKDRIFISSLIELANFSTFKPFFTQIQNKLITEMHLIPPKDLTKLAMALNKMGLLEKTNSQVISNTLITNIEHLDLHDIGSVLFSFHSIKDNFRPLVKKLTDHALGLIKSANKSDILKIFKSFSFYPESGFNKTAFEVVEDMQQNLTKLEIIDIIEQVWKCKAHAGSFEVALFSNLRILSNEEYATLVNRSSRYRDMMVQYRDKLLKNLYKRKPSEFSSDLVLFVVNGLHELGLGRQACEYFEKHIDKNIEKIELKSLYLLMYVMGIKEFGSRATWRKFDKIIRENYPKMTHLEKIWSLYGLFKAKKLKQELCDLIFDSLSDNEWCHKSLEKVMEIANDYEDKKTISRLIPAFIANYKDFSPNKGLICIDFISKAELMNPELYEILKYFKSNLKKPYHN